MQFADCVSTMKDIALTIGAFVGMWVALNGLATWKKELKGKSEYQLAKEVLFSVYEVREDFIFVCNLFRGGYEYSEDPENPTTWDWDLSDEDKYKRELNLYQNRWKKMVNTFTKLENKNLEAIVEWGTDYKEVIFELRKCKSTLQNAIHHSLQRKLKPLTLEMPIELDYDKRSVLDFQGGATNMDDLFTLEIDSAIKRINSGIPSFLSLIPLHAKVDCRHRNVCLKGVR